MKIIFLIFFGVILFAKNILILNSYSVQFPWTKGEVEGILHNLKNKNLKIFIEFMDTKLFMPTSEYLNNFENYLKQKYKNIHFDIVITTDDNALNFVLSNPLFEKSKIFFAGVNNLSLKDKIDRSRITGVFEKKEPLINLEILKRSVRNLKKVYIVADNSNSANAVIKEYKKAFSKIHDLQFIYINTSDLKTVLEKIKNSSHSGMLLLTPFSFKLNNKHIDYKNAIRLISKNYEAPIVIHTDILAFLNNTNVIGGKVTDAYSQGDSVSKKVLLYLNGARIEDIPLTFEKANKLYLNVGNIKKLHIDLKKLNFDNVIYVNKPNENEKYKKYLILTLIVVIVLFLFILLLLFKNYKLSKYSKKVKIENQSFETSINQKFQQVNEEYFKNLEIKYKTFIDTLYFILQNFNKLIFEFGKKCPEAKELKEIIDLYSYDIYKNRINVKDTIEKLLQILSKTKNYKNISVEGDEFEINFDKILFIKLMMDIINDNSKILINPPQIIIEYKNVNNLKEIVKYIKENFAIDIKLEKNKIILVFN